MTDEFRQLLLNLALIMGGNSQVFDAHGSPNREDRPLADPFRGGPAIDPEMDPARWRKLWDRCYFPDQRERLTNELRAHVDAMRFASRANANRALEWRIKVALDPRDARTVANIYRIGLSTVYLYRKQQRLREEHPGWSESHIAQVLREEKLTKTG